MTDQATLHLIAEHLARAMQPLKNAVADTDSFRSFIYRLGWQVESLPTEYVALAGLVDEATTTLASLGEAPTIEQVLALLEKVRRLYDAIQHLSTAPAGVDAGPFLAEVGERLFELLLVDYLADSLPALYTLLQALGVIEVEDNDETETRHFFLRTRLKYEEIPRLVSDPLLIPQRLYGWGTPDLKFMRIADQAQEFFYLLGLPAYIAKVSTDQGEGFQPWAPEDVEPIKWMVVIPILVDRIGDINIEAGLAVLELPRAGDKLPGIVVQPLVPSQIGASYSLSDDLTLRVRAGSNIASQLGVLLRPGEISVKYPFQPGTPLPSAGFGVSLEYAPKSPQLLFGNPKASRLQLQGSTLAFSVEERAGVLELRGELAVKDFALTVSPGEQDGFIGKLLGGADVRVPIPLTVRWSNRTGLTFAGSSSFTTVVSPQLQLGPVRVDQLRLSLDGTSREGQPPGLVTDVGIVLSGALGPFAFAVEEMGLQLSLVFSDGNAGPFNISAGAKPPKGIGLRIDSEVAAGGGYLFFDPAHGQYTGVLQLELAHTIAVKAIALLTTRMPDGSSGFSLLVIITAEGFAPIQLGFGFTLTGIGGLLGVNRTAAVEVLRSGIKTGTLGSILFPADPVRNAPRIVSDVGTVFPPASNRYVFGPMAVIEWGTPPILKMEIGLVLELPDPVRLLILGRITATLPDEKNALVQICMDALGVIDFARSLLSLDATLYDSRLLSFVLTGDMAMRLNWGSDPSFLLAIGGWNPRFPTPAGFPLLSRLMLTLSGNDNARLRFESYLAVTSNTVQFGARVDFYFALQPFSVEGFLAFDTLFSFSPFSFIADLGASAALQMNGTTLLSVGLNMTLSGPSPWRVRGTAEFSLLSFKQSIPFNVQVGPDRQPELAPAAVDVKGLLTAALNDARNWSSELPDGERPLVTFRPFPATGNILRVHPLAEVAIRERVVPLDRTISKFGNAPVSGERMFSLKAVRSDDGREISVQNISDSFALAQFADMSDDKKLSSPSFVKEHAGIRFTTGGLAYGYEPTLDVEIAYETLMISPAGPAQRLQQYVMPATVLDGTATLGAAALAATRRPGGTDLRMA